jgi:hypothetical protein
MTSQSALVTDTNIWIDMDNGGILAEVFKLPFHFWIPDLAIPELVRPNWQTLQAWGVIAQELEPELIQELFVLRSTYGRLSVTDLAAYLISREFNATLLTGDWRLSELASSAGVSVHGILWLLDELVHFNTLNTEQASNALKLIISGGGRLPDDECRKRFRLWSSEN